MTRQTRRSFVKLSGAVLGGIAAGSTVTAATSADRFIVDTKGHGGSLAGLDVVHDMSEVDLAVVEGDESDVESLGLDYAADTLFGLDLPADEVPVQADTAEAVDEPLYGLQWDKQDQDVQTAHETTRGEGARVAIIDTGVGAGHPDLQHAVNADLSKDFSGDEYGAPGAYGGDHGTHVAGIVAANDQNGVGTVGTAPGAEIVDCRVFALGELASFASIFAALNYATSIGCDVANMSLGSYPVSKAGNGDFYGKVVNRTVNRARSEGTLLVASAGNAGADLQHDGNVVSIPNEAAGAMSISATGPVGFAWGSPGLRADFDTPAVYTNYGTNAIDVSAHGGNFDSSAIGTGVPWYNDLVLNSLSTPITDGSGNIVDFQHSWGWIAGTSMAAPQVAGAAALVKSADPSLGPNQLRSTIRRTAEKKNGTEKPYHGQGALDPVAAVEDAS